VSLTTRLTLNAKTTIELDEPEDMVQRRGYGDVETVRVHKIEFEWMWNQDAETWELKWAYAHYRRIRKDGVSYALIQTDSVYGERAAAVFPQHTADAAASLPPLKIGAFA
jgi:hypothetical protein